MRNLVIATTGFLDAGTIGVAAALGLPQRATVRAQQQPAVTTMPMGGAMMAPTASAPTALKLTIQHVLRGCHTWSNSKTQSPMMRLTLKAGGRLSILDQDTDAHQLVQLSGPMRLHLGGPMMMGHGTVISFMKKGVYRLQTKTVAMPGGIDAKTIGPDNTLRLVITVA